MASNQPIIVKRKKVVSGGGHHGGAWKVAYADFVTAMMAFFMLMWLLNATTETQRKGIADYFSPEIPLARISGGGADAFGGDDVSSRDQFITTPGGQPTENGIKSAAGELPDELGKIEDMLDASSGESAVADDLLQHIVTRVTDEGLIVDLFDLPDATLFEKGTTRPTRLMLDLLAVVGEIFTLAENDIAINGHVRTEAIVLANKTAWELSTERAQTVRGLLTERGPDPERIKRIGGFADRELIHRNPMDLRNNRIELILLR
ncbi:flagellar motor protein MotB [Maribius pontilimi]|uniref:Flagellar motor protein MotB n=1 Tax=Palleronia pontilimi TaxID=1964209 RepID=A0A934MCP1_9RHOB|nr:flagellar motor protein MotB [Palleronia pontilimi]MBJ3761476.1 flagellar motor protein MotB [Palleronia pontilimi]